MRLRDRDRGTGAPAFVKRSIWCAGEISYKFCRWRFVAGRLAGALGRGEDALKAGISTVPSQHLAVTEGRTSSCFFVGDLTFGGMGLLR